MATEDSELFRDINKHLSDTAAPHSPIDADINQALQRAEERSDLVARRDEIYQHSQEWERMDEQKQEALRRLIPLINSRLSYRQENPEASPLTVQTTHNSQTSEIKRFTFYEGRSEQGEQLSVALFVENFTSSEFQANEFSNIVLRYINRSTQRIGEVRIQATPTKITENLEHTKRIFLSEENPELTKKYFAEEVAEWEKGGAVGREYPSVGFFERKKHTNSVGELPLGTLAGIIDVLKVGTPNSELAHKAQTLLSTGSTHPIETKLPVGAQIHLPAGLAIDL